MEDLETLKVKNPGTYDENEQSLAKRLNNAQFNISLPDAN